MAKYRKKPVVIEATQWFARGDHPLVMSHPTENYGLISAREEPVRVNPGDWIISGVLGEHYPCTHEVFVMTYEAA